MLRALAAGTACLACACAVIGPRPPEHFVRVWPVGKAGPPRAGVSTEVGVLVLAAPDLRRGAKVLLRFPFRGGEVTDAGLVVRSSPSLAVVQPDTARLLRGRLAGHPPDPGEPVYLALQEGPGEPSMTPVRFWQDGRAGDFVQVPGMDPLVLARLWGGTGLYVMREGRWQIVGVLSSLLARQTGAPGEQDASVGVGFLGLQELAQVTPELFAFFEHEVLPLRPDLEFDMPADGAPPEPDQEGGDDGR